MEDEYIKVFLTEFMYLFAWVPLGFFVFMIFIIPILNEIGDLELDSPILGSEENIMFLKFYVCSCVFKTILLYLLYIYTLAGGIDVGENIFFRWITELLERALSIAGIIVAILSFILFFVSISSKYGIANKFSIPKNFVKFDIRDNISFLIKIISMLTLVFTPFITFILYLDIVYRMLFIFISVFSILLMIINENEVIIGFRKFVSRLDNINYINRRIRCRETDVIKCEAQLFMILFTAICVTISFFLVISPLFTVVYTLVGIVYILYIEIAGKLSGKKELILTFEDENKNKYLAILHYERTNWICIPYEESCGKILMIKDKFQIKDISNVDLKKIDEKTKLDYKEVKNEKEN